MHLSNAKGLLCWSVSACTYQYGRVPSKGGQRGTQAKRLVQEPREGLAKVQNFLEQVALWSEPEKYAIEGAEDGAPDVVNVMTLHLSKGLEFDAVFIVGKLCI